MSLLHLALYFVPPRPKTGRSSRVLPNTEIARWNEELSEYLKK